MAKLQDIWSSLLCHEAVSFLIYGTFGFLLLVYIPYWIRQQLDKHFLRTLAKKARERHIQRHLEEMQRAASVPVDYAIWEQEDLGRGDREISLMKPSEEEDEDELAMIPPAPSERTPSPRLRGSKH